MPAEGVAPRESRPTQIAHVGPLPGVDSLVIDEGALVSEGAHALLTLEGALPGVGSLVSVQVAGAGKARPAFHAGERTQARVLA